MERPKLPYLPREAPTLQVTLVDHLLAQLLPSPSSTMAVLPCRILLVIDARHLKIAGVRARHQRARLITSYSSHAREFDAEIHRREGQTDTS